MAKKKQMKVRGFRLGKENKMLAKITRVRRNDTDSVTIRQLIQEEAERVAKSE